MLDNQKQNVWAHRILTEEEAGQAIEMFSKSRKRWPTIVAS